MGAFADYADYKASFEACPLASANIFTGYSYTLTSDLFADQSYAVAPTTAVALTSASTDANVVVPPLPATLTNQLWLGSEQYSPNGANGTSFHIIVDRLSVQGGLSGTVTTAQTTNLPTAALPRYTSGEGVMLGIRIHTAVGATATTLTCSYTNQAGTAGRTTKAISFSGTNKNFSTGLYIVPLQDGDSGVRSVESVTLAGSTGTAGSFGVVLFKPLFFFHQYNGLLDKTFLESWMGGKLIEVHPDACLAALTKFAYSGGGTASIRLVEA